MDSTQIALNIVIMSRLQLTVEAIQRLYRVLSDVDRQRYTELLAAYVGETAGYVHWVKGYAATETQLQPAGQALYELMRVMAADYGQEPLTRWRHGCLLSNSAWLRRPPRPKPTRRSAPAACGEPMPASALPLIRFLVAVPDFRAASGERYPLSAILALACAATVAVVPSSSGAATPAPA